MRQRGTAIPLPPQKASNGMKIAVSTVVEDKIIFSSEVHRSMSVLYSAKVYMPMPAIPFFSAYERSQLPCNNNAVPSVLAYVFHNLHDSQSLVPTHNTNIDIFDNLLHCQVLLRT